MSDVTRNVKVWKDEDKFVVEGGAKFEVNGVDILAALEELGNLPEELALLNNLTASAAELNILDGATITTAELNKLDGIGDVIANANTAANHVEDFSTLTEIDGSDSVDKADVLAALNALGAKINSILATLEAFGIMSSGS